MRQKIVYFPHPNTIGNPPGQIAVKEKPTRVWVSLLKDTLNAGEIVPRHGHNAMLQDENHDWRWSNGRLKFNGVGFAYLILEYDDAPTPPVLTPEGDILELAQMVAQAEPERTWDTWAIAVAKDYLRLLEHVEGLEAEVQRHKDIVTQVNIGAEHTHQRRKQVVAARDGLARDISHLKNKAQQFVEDLERLEKRGFATSLSPKK